MKVSVVLRSKKQNPTDVLLRYSDGSGGKNRKHVTLGKIDPAHWDPVKMRSKKADGNSLQLNAIIDRQLNEAQARIIKLKSMGLRVTFERMFEKEMKSNRLSEHIAAYMDEARKQHKFYTVRLMTPVYNMIRKGHDTNIALVNDEWVNTLLDAMKTSGKSTNTIYVYIRVLKMVINKALRAGQILRDPFAYMKFKKTPVMKNKLTRDELIKLRNLQDLEDREQMALDAFFLALYLYGARVRDVLMLKRSMIHGDRVVFKQSKTGKSISVKITPEIREILSRYNTHEYVLPYLEGKAFVTQEKWMRSIDIKTKDINSRLHVIEEKAQLGKSLTMHIARHTFASLANSSGLRVTDIQRLLNHSSLAVTEIYLNELTEQDNLDIEAAKIF
jgi:integrase/recombinase XerD